MTPISTLRQHQIMNSHAFTHQFERILVGAVSFDAYLEHMGRYLFAGPYVERKTVLDAACGTGYGAYYLANRGAKQVAGVDLSQNATAYANATYRMESLQFLSGDVTQMPFSSRSFDLIISFETVEHLHDPDSFISECKRLLAPNATLIISTPNQEVHSSQGIHVPFHEREFLLEEFQSIISRHFQIQTIYGQMPIHQEQLALTKTPPSFLQKIASWLPRRILRMMLPFYETYLTGNPLLPTIRYYLNGLQKKIVLSQKTVPYRYQVLPLNNLNSFEKPKTYVIVASA
jgi:2-polyprenyl-3-methyl-5-hydroxy-6-metoxy-1,4-benzoquinol methylase